MKKRKIAVLLLAMAMTGMMFTGCGPKEPSASEGSTASSDSSFSSEQEITESGTKSGTQSEAGSDAQGGTESGKTSSNKTPDANTSSKQSTDKPNEKINLKGRTITYLTYWEEPVKGADAKGTAYWEAKKKIEKEFNCKFKFVYGSFDNLATSIMSGKPICDVFSIAHTQVYNYYKQGLLYAASDLPHFDFKDYDKWFRPGMDYGKINGKQYAMCASSFESASFLVYNKDILKKYKQPDLYTLQKNGTLTWEKIFEIAKVCTNNGIYGISGSMWDSDAMTSLAIAYNGPYVKREGDTLKFTNAINSTGFINAFADFQKYAVNEKIVRPANSNWQYLNNEFTNGNTAIMIGGGLDTIANVNFDAGICITPKGKNASKFEPSIIAGVGPLSCIPATVDKPEEVAAVWNYMSSYIGNPDWRIKYQDYLSEDAMECVGQAVSYINNGNYSLDYSGGIVPEYSDVYNTLTAIAKGETTPAAGVQTFTTQLNNYLKNFSK